MKDIMSSLPFTLRQLDIFADLAQTFSFRTTAERLGISQASVSNQMKTLEDQLGFALLDRRPGKRPVMTREGHAFLDDLESLRAAARKLASHRRQTVEDTKPLHMRIFIGQVLMDQYIRPSLDRFLIENPTIQIDFVTQGPNVRLVEELPSGRYDFALMNVRENYPDKPFLKRLAKVAGGIYGHRKFAAGKSLPLSPQELSELPFILTRVGGSHEQLHLKDMEERGIVPRHVVAHSQYFDVMAAMLHQGLGVATFSESILPPEMRADVIQLHALLKWHLMSFSRAQDDDPRRKVVESFLIGCVLLNPAYPALTIDDPDWRAARARALG